MAPDQALRLRRSPASALPPSPTRGARRDPVAREDTRAVSRNALYPASMTSDREPPMLRSARVTTSRVIGPGYRNHPMTREITNAGFGMREGAAGRPSEGEPRMGPRQLARNETAATGAAATGAGTSAKKLAGHQASTAGAEAAAKGEIMESVSDPEFSLAVEVAYHDARQFFFEAAHRWAMFATIVLGASAVAPFGHEKPLALLAAMVAAADIAFDFTGRAQRHADLRRRYYELVADVANRGTEAADFKSRYMILSADEPPLYRWAQQIAWRNTCINQEKVVPAPLPLWKRSVAHVWRG